MNKPYQNNSQILCPCGTGKPYSACCQPFHSGTLPDSALELMRSRYSAYALCLPAYIIATTHPANPHFNSHLAQWTQDISEFCKHTEFKKLQILDAEEKDSLATVTFTAYLIQNKKDASFTEKSSFEKVNGKWLYLNGQLG
jgi:SEC-C motif-containing protein